MSDPATRAKWLNANDCSCPSGDMSRDCEWCHAFRAFAFDAIAAALTEPPHRAADAADGERRAAVGAEREACARIVEEYVPRLTFGIGVTDDMENAVVALVGSVKSACAQLIRARSEAAANARYDITVRLIESFREVMHNLALVDAALDLDPDDRGVMEARPCLVRALEVGRKALSAAAALGTEGSASPLASSLEVPHESWSKRVTMMWEPGTSDGAAVCSACRAPIPQGEAVHVRHGDRISRTAYPDDPTTFCVPCVTPREATPGEQIAWDWSRTDAAWALILPDLLAWDDPLDDLARRIDAALSVRPGPAGSATCSCGETIRELDAVIARLRKADEERADYCNTLWYLAEDRRMDVTRLREALRRAHACATLWGDGTCDGCFVSEALSAAALGGAAPATSERRAEGLREALETIGQMARARIDEGHRLGSVPSGWVGVESVVRAALAAPRPDPETP